MSRSIFTHIWPTMHASVHEWRWNYPWDFILHLQIRRQTAVLSMTALPRTTNTEKQIQQNQILLKLHNLYLKRRCPKLEALFTIQQYFRHILITFFSIAYLIQIKQIIQHQDNNEYDKQSSWPIDKNPATLTLSITTIWPIVPFTEQTMANFNSSLSKGKHIRPSGRMCNLETSHLDLFGWSGLVPWSGKHLGF